MAKYLHDIRKQLGLPAAIQMTKPPARTSKRSTRLVAKTYNVADLVVPLPGNPRAEDNPAGGGAKRFGMPDFEPLIALITSTVAVDSWSQSGGAGSIAPYPTSLSLVVSQTTPRIIVQEEEEVIPMPVRRGPQ